MKNKFIHKAIASAFCLTAAFAMSSCNDWTDIESLDIQQPDIADQNPELYAQYLENLRNFKNSDHKATYVWFDNSEKVPFNRAQHITTIPDSVDVVAMMYPNNLAPFEQEEMETVRNEKGTKFIFTMNFDAIKLIYDTRVADMENNSNGEEGEEPAPEMPTFIEFLVDSVAQTLPLVKKYNYDGISIGYKGKSILHMTDEEKALHTTYENAFIGIAKDWQERNPDKMIVLEGYPQNIIDKSVLPAYKHFIIPCTDAANSSKLTYNMISANVEGVPSDRFIPVVETTSLDAADLKTGYWADGVTHAIAGTATWAAAAHDYTVAGMGIYNVSNDYYNAAYVYQYTRNAISTINPSPKN